MTLEQFLTGMLAPIAAEGHVLAYLYFLDAKWKAEYLEKVKESRDRARDGWERSLAKNHQLLTLLGAERFKTPPLP